MTPQNLFIREPETLDGYTPRFNRIECQLGYTARETVPGRMLGNFYDDTPPEPYTEHSITVLGKKIIGRHRYYRGSVFMAAAAISREVLTAGRPGSGYEVYDWLDQNREDLANSIRYWEAILRLEGIQKAQQEIKALKERIRIAEILASVDALQVKENRSFNQTEYQLACIEFGMSQEEYLNLYR